METMKQPTVELSNKKLRQLPNVSKIQNFHLVWLDRSIDEKKDDCRESVTKLRQIVNTVNTFTDVDECIDFITDINDTNTFMIVSKEFGQIIMPIVQSIPQVSSVYIFCGNNIPDQEWTQQWSKVKGVYADIASISGTLKQVAQDCDHNSVSISLIKATDGASAQSLDTLDQSFMYTQILKEILLTINFEQSHINDFLTYYRAELAGNTNALKNVDKIAKEYRDHEPIWWYTYDSFLYSMANRALRLMAVDLIIKMGFFVRDLHRHITKLHTEQFSEKDNSNSFTVYRGQGLSQTVLDQLKNTQGGLMSFNNFLSTSFNRAVSHMYAESNHYSSGMIGVLFEIHINPSITSSPFANIKNVSHYEEEEELLFSMHSVFRIREVKQIDGDTGVWQVNLTLTSDTDPQLHDLTARIRKETFPTTQGWFRLGNLLVTLGQFDKAQQVFDIMLEQTLDQDEIAIINQMLGVVKDYQGKYTEAVQLHKKAFKIFHDTVPTGHPYLAACYSNFGSAYGNMGEYLKALSYYDKALKIFEKTLPPNHPDLADSYMNIGWVNYSMGEYLKSLSWHAKNLGIIQKTLPANHPSLATCYSDIGMVYDKMGEYSTALSYHEKALEILHRTLPDDHPSLATSYNNIGMVYDKMGEYSKALSYHEKSLKTAQRTLHTNHPSLAASYNNIGMVYDKMGEYSKALSYYEKTLEILHKTLPGDHPSFATSYNNIGGMYTNMGEYSKALSYYEKALEILHKTLPASHPSLATSYSNIGMVYDSIGEYSKALSYYEKALEIMHKTLPANHSSLATSYNNIGMVYFNMAEYSKALSYCEKALEILHRTLPANHPSLAASYNNIGIMYFNIGDYSKALSYYGKVLEILHKTLPANHPSLAASYNNIGMVHFNMAEYSIALSYCEKALEILHRTLPADHPSLATAYNNIGGMYTSMREYSKALSYYEKALEILHKTLPTSHPHFAGSYNNIATVYFNMREYSKALSYYEKALEILHKTLPANHPHIGNVKENIEIVKKKL